jgi:hypothetical protein
MAKFRKKPVVIEAFQFTGWTNSFSYMPRWFMSEEGYLPEGTVGEGGGVICESTTPQAGIACIIKTLEGSMRAEVGDWIIKGIKGEFYPCKPDIFEATYEPA